MLLLTERQGPMMLLLLALPMLLLAERLRLEARTTRQSYS
jgi:hypothetical protein